MAVRKILPRDFVNPATRGQPLRFVPFTPEMLDSVRAFNRRMQDGQAQSEFLLIESCDINPVLGNGTVQWMQHLALEGDEVRGGVIEMAQPGWLNRKPIHVVNFQSPVSEGIVNKKHTMVAMRMVKFMQQRSDAVFIVGMGSASKPLPRLLKAAGWSLQSVPFLFRVHRTRRFLRELRLLHRTRLRSMLAYAAAATGVDLLTVNLIQVRWPATSFTIREVKTWGTWADEIWERFRPHCSFAVERTVQALEALYPANDPRLTIFLMEDSGGNPAGWAACFDTRTKNHRHFGDLRVGTILDCVAAPDTMRALAVLTDSAMAARGVDLTITNLSHAMWNQAFRRAGFLSGPSNYLLGMSPTLTAAIQNASDGATGIHITRGDGDGRTNLG